MGVISLLQVFPSFETVLRVIGAGYILWLAYETLRASYAFQKDDQSPMGFASGLWLQVLNPKVVVYGLTLYSTFLASITVIPAYLVVSALFLAAMAFWSVSTWTLFGSAIRTYLHQPGMRRLVNLGLSLLLVYTAIELSGLAEVIQ